VRARARAESRSARVSAAERLTDAQLAGLRALADGETHRTSTETDDSYRWIHGGVAKRLEKVGCASSHYVLPWGTEIRGTDLVKYLGHWHTEYRITKFGRAVLYLANEFPRKRGPVK
jgi:hypothetical protein